MVKKVAFSLCALLLLTGCSCKKGGMMQEYAAESKFIEAVGPDGDKVYFDFDRSDIKAEGRATLARQAEWFRAHPNAQAVIEGHTDPRGTVEYNMGLGKRRAHSAMQELASQGVKCDNVTTTSYGKSRLVSNGDCKKFHLDRRAVTVVESSGSSFMSEEPKMTSCKSRSKKAKMRHSSYQAECNCPDKQRHYSDCEYSHKHGKHHGKHHSKKNR